ncbi:MAG: hypothetical protein KDE03_10125 [Rhodobacteraceae bacterium]|nr:hypothetical protein [Paracoccaceae bacterium]
MARKSKLVAGHGVIVKAANGDVISYDQTGLTMRLSDRVIEDIALRLGTSRGETGSMGAEAGKSANAREVADLLDGIDAWDPQIDGDWLVFSARLPGRQGVRRYRRPITGGQVIADTPGPIYGLLGLGGPRAAHAFDGRPDFPQHILAPADDIGAVGHAGVERAAISAGLEQVREMTREALVANALLNWRLDEYDSLPLIMTRVETDSSATSASLSDGMAFDNMIAAAKCLKMAAQSLGKKPKLLAILLDFALEEMSGSASAYRDGMLALMARAEDELGKLGYDRPLFVALFESGTPEIATSAAIEGQWELAWNHGEHRLVFAAPSYMFALDPFDRLTEDGARDAAEMVARAVLAEETWRCPVLHLAERSVLGGGKTIRVVARSIAPLIIDADDPFGAGKSAGFTLVGAENGAKIKKVECDSSDPMAILVHCDKRPEGTNLRLGYAHDPQAGKSPGANAGSLRDDWQLQGRSGRMLYRWALPVLLPITDGGGRDA